LVTDDEDLASQFAEETFSVTKDGEKKMKEKVGGVWICINNHDACLIAAR